MSNEVKGVDVVVTGQTLGLLTADELVVIRDRAAAATEGPWLQGEHVGEPRALCAASRPLVSLLGLDVDGMAIVESAADATFIAHAREDVPRLIAHALAVGQVAVDLAAERDRLRAKVDVAFGEVKAGLERERVLRGQLALVATDTDGVWRWQGDGGNEPESLTCPVVMSADTLRSFVAARASLAAIRLAAESLLATSWTHGEDCPHRDCDDGECDGAGPDCEANEEPCDCLVSYVAALRAALAGAS